MDGVKLNNSLLITPKVAGMSTGDDYSHQ